MLSGGNPVERRGVVCMKMGIVLLLALPACTYVVVSGPVSPATRPITRVTVTALDRPAAPPAMVTEPRAIAAIKSSWAFAQTGWRPAEGRELLPLYRVELHEDAGPPAVYWLGANSHPPRFPCYSACTGFWVSPSLPSGGIDASRYKGLADGVAFPLFQHLPLAR